MLRFKFSKRGWYLLTIISTSFFVFSINDRVNAVPLDSILNQLIEKVLGVNLNSAGEGNNAGTYPSPEMVPEQTPYYPSLPQAQPQFSQPYPYFPPQSPAQPMNSPQTQPLFLYNPVYMMLQSSPPAIINNNR